MDYSYIRCGCVSPELSVCDTELNSTKIISKVLEAEKKEIQLLSFPELCITSYTCADLFFQSTLLENALKALKTICDKTKKTSVLCAVGLPVKTNDAIYNCAALIQKGEVLAVIPKTFIPTYNEFYERRWFKPYSENDFPKDYKIDLGFCTVPFGAKIIVEDKTNPDIKIACEICEDAWVTKSPSVTHCLNGATVILNLSASNEVVGKANYRRMLVQALSAKNLCAYIYANAGKDESSTDLIFSGHNLICSNGTVLKESQLFSSNEIIYADIDLEKIAKDRIKTTTFSQCAQENKDSEHYRHISINLKKRNLSVSKNCLTQIPEKHPFVPESSTMRKERCFSVIQMQSEGLAKRLKHIQCKACVIGISGGLDSTLALLVTVKAFKILGLNTKNIYAITLPCFGTTNRTYTNACTLSKNLGTTLVEINIEKAVRQHFSDIKHDESVHNITYENCQARERTQILMDYANKVNGIVIGTGDLSELALGWCTYNGDHMSMYGVNSSIPKTLVRYLVEWFADDFYEQNQVEVFDTLKDILETPVSPELLPSDGKNISQKTEEIVGPYELHDFILYYVLRFGFTPTKIYFLACQTFLGEKIQGDKKTYTKEIILKWLKNFYRRFFSQQFKRSCMPDGAKVGTVNLSPRGDWRMPSDASASLWLKEIEALEEAENRNA